ncbi:putative reverse transcriptase domain-containing protein [Tanacetum coccineum]
MPPEDHVFPAEEQPLPAVVSPTADSPGYIPEAGAARHDVPAIPREDPYVVAREDLYKFVDMVDDAPRHPGCPISRRLDYASRNARDGPCGSLYEEIAPTTIEGSQSPIHIHLSLWSRGSLDWPVRAGDFYGRLATIPVSHVYWALRTTVVEQRALISGLQAADHQRQFSSLTMATKLLKGLQIQMAEFQRHQGPAEGPTQLDAPEEAASRRKLNEEGKGPQEPQAMINEGVTAALAARDTTRNGDDSHSSGVVSKAFCKCSVNATYPDFPKMPTALNFKGTEGVVWDLPYDDALTWWNSHVKTTTPEAAHAMPWAALKKMMTDKYCPRGEIKKIETEMWNLKVKGTDVVAYNQRFQQLALMCARMFPKEIDKIEKYIGGLPDMIHGSVKASKPKTMQEAIEFTTELMDEKTHAYAEHQAEKKRKYDDLSKNNQNQQQQNKRQNTGQAYTAGNSDRKPYAGSKPLCFKCNYNHEGPCPLRCNNCKKVGHLAKDCRSRPANANNNNRYNNNRNNNNNNQKGNGCFECGAQGHFRRNCPKLKNNDRGNQAGNDRAPARVYAVGNEGGKPRKCHCGYVPSKQPLCLYLI